MSWTEVRAPGGVDITVSGLWTPERGLPAPGMTDHIDLRPLSLINPNPQDRRIMVTRLAARHRGT